MLRTQFRIPVLEMRKPRPSRKPLAQGQNSRRPPILSHPAPRTCNHSQHVLAEILGRVPAGHWGARERTKMTDTILSSRVLEEREMPPPHNSGHKAEWRTGVP